MINNHTLTRLQSLKDQLTNIERELDELKNFRLTPALKRFKRQLEGEKSFVKSEIAKLETTKAQKEQERQLRREIANRNRSSKNKRVWNYVKSIKENYFPDKSLKEIRSSLKKHRHGLETDIPDVAWRNPSP